MHAAAQALQAEGVPVIDLSLGAPDFKPPLAVQQAAKEAIASGRYFGYPPVAGFPALRAAIAQKLQEENQIPCSPEQVVVTNGAKQALFLIFSALLDPGDEVVVYAPCWPSYGLMIRLAGGRPVLLHGRAEEGFVPAAGQLAQAITPRTKAVIFANPCNPTGRVLARPALEAMAAVVARHPRVVVVADEIYEYINFTGAPLTSLGALPGMAGRVVTVNGFSKGWAMPGWRVGYLAGPVWLARACEALQGQMTAGVCAVAQQAALQVGGEWLRERVAVYQQRRDVCVRLLRQVPGVRVGVPQGAFYLFPDVSACFGRTMGGEVIQDAAGLCRHLLYRGHVALVPGDAFGAPGHVRLAFVAPQLLLEVGLERLLKTLLDH